MTVSLVGDSVSTGMDVCYSGDRHGRFWVRLMLLAEVWPVLITSTVLWSHISGVSERKYPQDLKGG